MKNSNTIKILIIALTSVLHFAIFSNNGFRKGIVRSNLNQPELQSNVINSIEVIK